VTLKSKRKPWGWHTRYRHHKHDEPHFIPDFLKWWRKRKIGGQYPLTIDFPLPNSYGPSRS